MNELYLLAEQPEVQALFVFPRPVAFKRLLRAVGSFETDRVLFETWVCATQVHLFWGTLLCP